jgi:hypothetical protein
MIPGLILDTHFHFFISEDTHFPFRTRLNYLHASFDFTIPILILGIGWICLLGITVFVLSSKSINDLFGMALLAVWYQMDSVI